MAKVYIEDVQITGEGEFLYAVTSIDTDDSEDTSTTLWLANDEEHLYEQVKEDWDIDTFQEDYFQNDWGCTILWTKLGTKMA
jgi:hypothetical protein